MSGPEKNQQSLPGVFRVNKWIPRRVKIFSSYDEQSDDHRLLKQFDMNWEYGPCINISRLQRWKRASDLGLNPPIVVKDLILKHFEDPKYNECIWSKYSNLLIGQIGFFVLITTKV